MKLFISGFLLALGLMVANQGFSQVMLRGRFGITPYIGIPSSGRVTTQSLSPDYGSGNSSSETFAVTGPAVELGLKMEYLVTDVIGLALETNYEKAGYAYTYSTYDANSNQVTQTQSWSQTKIRALARMQFHVLKSEKVDLYPGFGIGFCATNIDHPENTPSIDSYNIFAPIVFIDRITNPLAARIFFGANFMFTRNIGLNTEVGIGSGSVIKLGLAAYF